MLGTAKDEEENEEGSDDNNDGSDEDDEDDEDEDSEDSDSRKNEFKLFYFHHIKFKCLSGGKLPMVFTGSSGIVSFIDWYASI